MAAGGRQGKASLANILMELRKAANHPYLITGAEESLVQRALLDSSRAKGGADADAAAHPPPRALTPDASYRLFVDVSGKLRLLERLLPRLAARGHRVLLFSGFKIVLDVLEDFIRGLVLPPLPSAPAPADGAAAEPPCPPAYRAGRTLLYSRIDGDTDQRTRQRVIDAYNRPASKLFALLMTTRAGGQGLNLATADTVIIFDRCGEGVLWLCSDCVAVQPLPCSLLQRFQPPYGQVRAEAFPMPLDQPMRPRLCPHPPFADRRRRERTASARRGPSSCTASSLRARARSA